MFERMAILGAGAIGSILGGYLTRAGCNVTLIDPWAAHVEAIREKGLKVTAQDHEFTVHPKIMHLGEACKISEPFDAIFLSVKSYDTIWATHFLLPHLKPTGVVISAQNGMNDAQVGSIAGFSRSMGCVITLGGALYDPGHVLRTSSPARHALTVGEPTGMASPRAKALAEILGVIGPTKMTTNLWGERWAKLATNCMANSLSGITGLGSAASRETPGVVDVAVKIGREVALTGKALGVQVEPINAIPAELYERCNEAEALEELKTRLAAGARESGAGRPSMLQDIMKGRRTEIDYLNGYLVTRGAEAGVPTPFNAAVTRLVKQVEQGKLKPDAANIKRLEAIS